MNIIVSNKYSDLLKSLNIEVIKEVNGVHSADEIGRQLENIYYDRLIFDISALKDNLNIASFQRLSAVLDMSKVILLIDDTRYFSTKEFISQIISIGIYNFTKNIEGVSYLLEHPNSYGDVMKYHNVDLVKKEEVVNKSAVDAKKYTTIEDVYNSQVLTPAEKDRIINKMRMQETVKRAKMSGEESDYIRKRKILFRLFLIFIMLPLIAVSMTFFYHFMLYNFDGWISDESNLGKVLFRESVKDGPTVIQLLMILLTIALIKIFYSIINVRIRSLKTSCLKFSIIPFGVFTAIINFDKYIVTFLDKYIKTDAIDIKTYMNTDIYFNFKVICVLMIIVYYMGLFFNSVKTIEFEQEISRKTTIIEKLYIFIIFISALLPGLHYLFNTYTQIGFVTDFFNALFGIDNLMLYITIVQIAGLIGMITLDIVNFIKIRKIEKAELNA